MNSTDAAANYMPTSMTFALLIHAIVVLGLQFLPERSAPASRLEITLASYKHDKAPDEADFIAQENQLGSGSETEKRLLTTTERALFPDNTPRQQPQAFQPAAQRRQTANLIALARPKPSVLDSSLPPQLQQKSNTAEQSPTEAQRSQNIASLEAKLALQRQLYAKRPRVRRITSLSTKSAADARYQLNWQQIVEQIGNENYPQAAREKKLEGDVRLMVALHSDGRIKEIVLLASSGYRELDIAAMQSVKMAAPFEPFPAAIRIDTEILEIVRTWQFRRNHLSSS